MWSIEIFMIKVQILIITKHQLFTHLVEWLVWVLWCIWEYLYNDRDHLQFHRCRDKRNRRISCNLDNLHSYTGLCDISTIHNLDILEQMEHICPQWSSQDRWLRSSVCWLHYRSLHCHISDWNRRSMASCKTSKNNLICHLLHTWGSSPDQFQFLPVSPESNDTQDKVPPLWDQKYNWCLSASPSLSSLYWYWLWLTSSRFYMQKKAISRYS